MRVTTLVTDGAGRVFRTTDRAGRSAQVTCAALDLVTSLEDGLGGTTSFTYDGNGNLLTLTDARSKTTTWTYTNTWTEPISCPAGRK